MSAEIWKPAPGYGDMHEVSDRGRVRTTAQGTSGTSGMSWLLLLLLAAVAVAVVWKAQLVNTLATAVVVSLCTVPALWLVREALGEWKFRRLYDRPRTPVSAPRRQPLVLPCAPLAIEAARPVVIDMAIEHERARMDG